jgi:hypothetical protein
MVAEVIQKKAKVYSLLKTLLALNTFPNANLASSNLKKSVIKKVWTIAIILKITENLVIVVFNVLKSSFPEKIFRQKYNKRKKELLINITKKYFIDSWLPNVFMKIEKSSTAI